jgi:hypothetical protein
MTSPQRIQRKRTKGWRMPEDAIYVGRPTPWGNPWKLSEWAWLARSERDQRDLAVTCLEDMINEYADIPVGHHGCVYPSPDEIRRDLAGHDLACWCPLDQPCHADVLLEIANGAA